LNQRSQTSLTFNSNHRSKRAQHLNPHEVSSVYDASYCSYDSLIPRFTIMDHIKDCGVEYMEVYLLIKCVKIVKCSVHCSYPKIIRKMLTRMSK